MAVYAALLSLMTTLNNIKIHPRVSTFFYYEQIQSLHQIINSLLHFMERSNSHGGSRDEEEALERRIVSTAHAAEDVIESHVVKQIVAVSTHLIDLETLIEDMNSVKETVIEFQGYMIFKDEQSFPASSKPLTTTKKDLMVGFDEKVIQIMDRLTAHQPGLQILPIVGMGGIGKTTLATSVYHNSLIVDSFDIRAWITISQEYTVKYVLSQLLSCIKDRSININIGVVDCGTELETEDHKLGLKLYQTLWGRRYLIVLDDMWSVEAWDKIKFYFPNNNDRSRVVITTRIWSVATPLSSSSFEMNFLDKDPSWRLFCGNVFLEKDCPSELEEIGKKIVRECKGLPLSIVVIGGLLRNSIRTREYWHNFAIYLNSILMSGNDEHCLNILSLSYNQLPGHLKPCFLYMGVFLEDENIRVSKLIKLLVAEEFLKPKEGQTLEEVADDCLNDLLDRNLILVDSWRWNGRMKYCKMHDLVREVCLKIGEREKIFHNLKMFVIPSTGIFRERRIVVEGRIFEENNWLDDLWSSPYLVRTTNWLYDLPSSASLMRTLFCIDEAPPPFKFRLLRVLTRVKFKSQEDISQHANLRYLHWTLNYGDRLPKLPSSVSLLWNVHSLIFEGFDELIEAPSEIWYMQQLRHLIFPKIFLPDPPPCEKVEQQDDDVLFPNLHTLSTLVNFSFTERVCKRISNIKKLCIVYDDFSEEEWKKKCYYDLGHLHKLQSLNFSCRLHTSVQSLVLPSSLGKLCLQGCYLHWENLNTIGLSLPHLQFLKLCRGSIVGDEWDCVDGAFPRLKVLHIKAVDLIIWSAESSKFFPVLQKLHLEYLWKLERIPSGMGEIQTLGSLRLDSCSVSVGISSMEILEEQLSFGNDDLQLVVHLSTDSEEEKKSFMEKVEINNFTTKNFKVDIRSFYRWASNFGNQVPT